MLTENREARIIEHEYIYNYEKLLQKIRIKFKSQEKFVEKIGIGRVSLSQRLKNRSDFSQNEMARAVDALGLSYFEIPELFFDSTKRQSPI